MDDGRLTENKVCLVTGATSGIGQVTVGVLAALGATVVVAGRSREKCAATVEEIRRRTASTAVEYLVADLSSQEEVGRLAGEFRQRHRRLDVLVNNAGAYFLRRMESVDGLEMTLAVNHLAPFLLTNLLLDVLKAGAPARVVNVASDAHAGGRIDFDDLQGRRGYSGRRAYAQSKLANVLFTYELARRLAGSGVTANALHPGFVASNFATNNGRLVRLFWSLARLVALSPKEGAQTVIYLAASPEVEGVTGQYFVRQKAVPSAPASYDAAVAGRLWEVSAELVGLSVTGRE
ncbi:MAG: SDR family oxidoreductase [Chloroflexi bacterium]|nr:SDR family oxidoreductase [Chloroflexota bacterium]MCI0575480.1 SDR family oxidoreductase [Chloroflexota bacterium]MCI0728968.1 SDR family oxidoreductase [Chloroflexota bacterium]